MALRWLMSLMFARSVAAMVNTGLWVPAQSAANFLESSPCHASASCEVSPSILFISAATSSDSPRRMRAWASTTSGFMPSHELPPPLLFMSLSSFRRTRPHRTRAPDTAKLCVWSCAVDGEHSPRPTGSDGSRTGSSRHRHLEHLRAAALHEEPATLGYVRPGEQREP